ncbi:MAG: DM13 domain-containing protein [Gammaproteobacteria bacterium]|nr:DM13 domain-containing protein [Gammaproteobacteria bacterium]
MKRALIGFVVGGLLGAGLGFTVGIAVFPYLFPPPEVNEPLPGKTQGDAIAHATFIHANPSDPIHYGRGTATIYPDLLRLESDFEVGPGPKFHVYLVPLAEVTPDTEVEKSMYVDLGRLKAFAGSQNYAIPAGIDLANFRSVVIWCEQFNVLISPATISPVAPISE